MTDQQRIDEQAALPEPQQESGLRALGTLLRRRALIILIPLLVVPTAAVIFSLQKEKKYTAEASLLFSDSADGSQLASDSPERESATNIRLLESDAIKERVTAKFGGSAQGEVKVIGEGDANLVQLSATARSPETAALLANAYAREFIAFRRETLEGDIRDEQRRIRDEIAALPSTAASQRRGLRLRLRELKVEEATASTDVRQVKRATPPTKASSPKPGRDGLIGLVIGLVLGLGLALARERLDLRVRDPRSFEHTFQRPIIGKIPNSRALEKTPPGSALPEIEGQAFADLRANLRYVFPNGDDRSVLVTSAEANEGKTTVSWNLARAAAAGGAKVLLVEADLRRPGLSAKLRTNGTPGLSDMLQATAELAECIREIPVPVGHNGTSIMRTVHVLFAGSPSADPTGLLESARMEWLLAWGTEHYDLVVVDTPPTSIASDAVPLVGNIGGVIVVGRLAKSRQSAITELAKQLRHLNAPTLGVVVNATQLSRDTYRYYYQRSYAE